MTRASHVPDATYRWQLNGRFTLRDASALVAHLDRLGVSACYASPLLTARRGSQHGYDVIDHTRLNPELGSKSDFIALAAELKNRGLGLILDVVPNHICIAGGGNRWWEDILEDGPGSIYARYLDIDWNPPKSNLHDKVLLPTLGEQYGRVLENQDIQLEYRRGKFLLRCYDSYLPLAPESTLPVLRLVRERSVERIGESHIHVYELESIISALDHLPPRQFIDRARVRERQREKVIIRRRLGALTGRSRVIKRALDEALRVFNGVKGDPQSFDRLEEMLARQPYRLCYWRVAADEINYRRFFDVNELAAIRVEEPAVFTEVHELIFGLMGEGWVTGLRIDHIDGLYDPARYLVDLRRGASRALRRAAESPPSSGAASVNGRARSAYVVVEKILGTDEPLRATWEADGTTGYDFLNQLNGIFVDRRQGKLFHRLYERLTGVSARFHDIVYECKKLILRVSMSSELHVLARRLDRISEQHRYSRDFTLNSLQDALGEVIACFPVYRTYIRPGDTEASAEDRRAIGVALRDAKRRNPATSPSLFDFIGGLLLLEDPPGLSDKQTAERREFVMRFQQLTGPVTAKGVEDTAFYRWFPLASLNEVGGDPSKFGASIEEFHHRNAARARDWPRAMLATSTHDTKRGEDVRARLNVLSEIPGRWYRAIRRWQQADLAQRAQPDQQGRLPVYPNEEYLIYQTIIGTWPFGATADDVDDGYVRRIEEYLIKAVREAKIHSSWLSPNEEYEAVLIDYIRRLLSRGGTVLQNLVEFQRAIAQAGVFNSLSQTLLKIASPGVPDFYQGSELWDFNLVDPDNRRPVDYQNIIRLFDELDGASSVETDATWHASQLDEMARNPADGRIKLYLTYRALRLRRARRECFLGGEYAPLAAEGELKDHVIAFARRSADQCVIALAGRFFVRLMGEGQPPVGGVWDGNLLAMSGEFAGSYRDWLTGLTHRAETHNGGCTLELTEVFAHLPVALLERVE